MRDMADDKKRPSSRSERFRNYCLGIASLSALILGVWANVKGEPKADKAWATAQKKLTENRDTINKLNDGLRRLHLLFVHMQGQSEGYNNAKLMTKMAEQEAKIDQLTRTKATPARRKPAIGGGAGASPAIYGSISNIARKPKKKCPPGWVRIKGRCSKSRTAIAKAVTDARSQAIEARRKMLKERARHRTIERAKVQRPRMPEPKPPAKLMPVPKSLDKASKPEK